MISQDNIARDQQQVQKYNRVKLMLWHHFNY
jgi:hypothetical protein